MLGFSQSEAAIYKHDSIYNFLFDRDSVIINTERGSVLSKSELLFLEKKYPQLLNDVYLLPPDESYYRINHLNKDTIFHHFSSEAGQDNFYILYGYFLSIRNGIEKYKTERKKLIDIYETINSIHSTLQHGGTYFGHMSWRILGYAEYGIYLVANYSQDVQIDYLKQKQFFIQSLRQSIGDEVSSQEDIINKNKLFDKINKLDNEIDNYLYLSMARKFEYANY